MNFPKEMEDYIKESVDHSLGLPVSSQTLETKIYGLVESQNRLRERYLSLLSKVKDKDRVIEQARAEASMNAQALKKFVEENHKLAAECANLAGQCSRWERECSLYDHDREALMDFGNEADERAKEAEGRVIELEQKLGKVLEDLQYYKHEYELQKVKSCTEERLVEETMLDSLLTTVLCKEEYASSARAFLEANSNHESFQKFLKMWNQLRPSTQKVLSLAAEVKKLENDKEHLRINLHRAEEEGKLFAEENNILDEENKRLLRKINEDRKHLGSSGKLTASASVKSNKRKSSPTMTSPVEKMMDFNEVESGRRPLSPLSHNSPDCRLHKKK